MFLNEPVSIIADGKHYTGWKNVHIKRSIETVAATFNFTGTDNQPDSSVFSFIPGMSVVIMAGDDVLLTGYVNSVEPSVSPEEHSINIAGRCKTQDAVDCSAEVPASSWAEPTPLNRMCYDLVKPYGITVKAEAPVAMEMVPKGFMLNAGESPIEAIQRLCADRALLAIGDERGRLLLTTAGLSRAFDAVRYGINVKSAQGKYDDSDRFSKYTVKGDESTGGDGWTEGKISISSSATDSSVQRFRLKIIKAPEQMTTALAKKKAAWEAQIRAGKAGEVRCTMAGWRQSNNALWCVNTLVVVDIAPLKVMSTEMLITEIAYNQDEDSGSTAEIILKRPDIYAPDPEVKVKKSSKALVWE